MNTFHNKRNVLMFSLLVLLMVACTQNDVDIVKDGTMNGYQATTVGAAFDASFDNPKWSEFVGEKGKRVVEFSGKITKAVLLDLMGGIANDPNIQHSYAQAVLSEPEYQQIYEGSSGEGTTPVNEVYRILFDAALRKVVGQEAVFQWFVTPDGERFSLAYIDNDVWGPLVRPYGADKNYVYNDEAILNAIYK
ncbi:MULTISPECIES: hypothetical protein [unclassified Pseudodesulfovibrio]|uniref:hypothetical protein n=1 Tax=unclassified Pseudodesulfovibrio TaxID=2661612 RepID=UPI000FEB8DD8|nr:MULTISPECIES: hypothetical protein [unclassified Pseudodesulfovibrio]MCJ2165229.1 hypothetical protein [Pseudodesulfovibrio sp. S3-i]RWU03283.1 hypothetical protein DWB63_11815 [Pseudodesulfovibrio sp. S3]